MLKVGSYVMYGKSGVCKIEAVGPVAFDEDKKSLYYTLSPVYHDTGTIYTPVNNEKVVIRPLISKKEAAELIRDFSKLKTLSITNEKEREETYKKNIKACDCKEILRLIKTIHQRSQKRLANGSKVTANDEKYLSLAKDRLYGEFAISLKIDKGDVEEYIEKVQEGIAG